MNLRNHPMFAPYINFTKNFSITYPTHPLRDVAQDIWDYIHSSIHVDEGYVNVDRDYVGNFFGPKQTPTVTVKFTGIPRPMKDIVMCEINRIIEEHEAKTDVVHARIRDGRAFYTFIVKPKHWEHKNG